MQPHRCRRDVDLVAQNKERHGAQVVIRQKAVELALGLGEAFPVGRIHQVDNRIHLRVWWEERAVILVARACSQSSARGSSTRPHIDMWTGRRVGHTFHALTMRGREAHNQGSVAYRQWNKCSTRLRFPPWPMVGHCRESKKRCCLTIFFSRRFARSHRLVSAGVQQCSLPLWGWVHTQT